jgi:uncharacterized protein YraI
MRLKQLILASGILLLSAGAASAAVVTDNVNLRSGPGIRYSVIDAVPAGASVRVHGCSATWCRVVWNGQKGYASRNYLAHGGSDAYASYAYQPESSYESYANQPGQYYDTSYCPYYGSNNLWWCH